MPNNVLRLEDRSLSILQISLSTFCLADKAFVVALIALNVDCG